MKVQVTKKEEIVYAETEAARQSKAALRVTKETRNRARAPRQGDQCCDAQRSDNGGV